MTKAFTRAVIVSVVRVRLIERIICLQPVKTATSKGSDVVRERQFLINDDAQAGIYILLKFTTINR